MRPAFEAPAPPPPFCVPEAPIIVEVTFYDPPATAPVFYRFPSGAPDGVLVTSEGGTAGACQRPAPGCYQFTSVRTSSLVPYSAAASGSASGSPTSEGGGGGVGDPSSDAPVSVAGGGGGPSSDAPVSEAGGGDDGGGGGPSSDAAVSEAGGGDGGGGGHLAWLGLLALVPLVCLICVSDRVTCLRRRKKASATPPQFRDLAQEFKEAQGLTEVRTSSGVSPPGPVPGARHQPPAPTPTHPGSKWEPSLYIVPEWERYAAPRGLLARETGLGYGRRGAGSHPAAPGVGTRKHFFGPKSKKTKRFMILDPEKGGSIFDPPPPPPPSKAPKSGFQVGGAPCHTIPHHTTSSTARCPLRCGSVPQELHCPLPPAVWPSAVGEPLPTAPCSVAEHRDHGALEGQGSGPTHVAFSRLQDILEFAYW